MILLLFGRDVENSFKTVIWKYFYRADFEEVGNALYEWYEVGNEERKRCGELGREFTLAEEVGMSGKNMCSRFIKDIDTTLEKWTPRPRFETYTL